MPKGTIVKALSGFYYVKTSDSMIQCRARGRFRKDGMSPLVGDHVTIINDENNEGRIEEILPRKNSFIRPAVANIDTMVFVAANVNPITDPFLIDRVSVICEHSDCELIICVNKSDLDPGEEFFDIYNNTGFKIIGISAENGQGIDELKDELIGKKSVFTGNSGVGKSSILNKMQPNLSLKIDDVSERLGRGKHTTRHVEFHEIAENTFMADTPGFASFEVDMVADINKDELQYCFPEFRDYIGHCRFDDCTHRNEPNCAVLDALHNGSISSSRHESYVRIYDVLNSRKEWEQKNQRNNV